jgi:hypothetical protein
MLNYPYKRGEIGIVGAYYRNQMMIRASKNRKEYEACCDERSSKMEGFLEQSKQTPNWMVIIENVAGRRSYRKQE